MSASPRAPLLSISAIVVAVVLMHAGYAFGEHTWFSAYGPVLAFTVAVLAVYVLPGRRFSLARLALLGGVLGGCLRSSGLRANGSRVMRSACRRCWTTGRGRCSDWSSRGCSCCRSRRWSSFAA